MRPHLASVAATSATANPLHLSDDRPPEPGRRKPAFLSPMCGRESQGQGGRQHGGWPRALCQDHLHPHACQPCSRTAASPGAALGQPEPSFRGAPPCRERPAWVSWVVSPPSGSIQDPVLAHQGPQYLEWGPSTNGPPRPFSWSTSWRSFSISSDRRPCARQTQEGNEGREGHRIAVLGGSRTQSCQEQSSAQKKVSMHSGVEPGEGLWGWTLELAC